MKVVYEKTILEDIVELLNNAALSRRSVVEVKLSKQEAEEFDLLLIQSGKAKVDDKLTLDKAIVMFCGIPVSLDIEPVVH